MGRWLDSAKMSWETILSSLNPCLIAIAAIVLLFPSFSPQYLNDQLGASWKTVHQFWTYGSFALSFCLLLLGARKKGFVALVLTIALVTLVSTKLNGGHPSSWYATWAAWTLPAMVVAVFAQKAGRPLVVGIFILTTSLSLLNLGSMIICPEGFLDDRVFFFGNRNHVYKLAIPGILSGALLGRRRSGLLGAPFLVASLLAVGQSVAGGSTTSLLTSLLEIALMIFATREACRRPLTLLSTGSLSIISCVLVVLVRIQEKFAWLLATLFHKNATLTGRTAVWDATITLLGSGGLLIGYGMEGYRLLVVNGLQFPSTHNLFLYLVFNGGIICFVVFGAILLLDAKELYRTRQEFSSAALSIAVAAFLVEGIAESAIGGSLFLILALAYYWPTDSPAGPTVLDEPTKPSRIKSK
ncbi:MAG: hypothetical protein HFJ66_01395 [Eggerthellaceae bacterium]|nr:hypothetical protein [Eggerthellaceae bacterium]